MSTAAAWGPLSHRLENVRVLAGLRRVVLVWQGPDGDWKHMLRCRDDMVPQAEARLLEDLLALYHAGTSPAAAWPDVLRRWHAEAGWFEAFKSDDGEGFFAAFCETGLAGSERTAEWLALTLPSLAAAANDSERRHSFYGQRQAVLESAASLSRSESESELWAYATRLARRLFGADAAACLASPDPGTESHPRILAADPETPGAHDDRWLLDAASIEAITSEGRPVLLGGQEAQPGRAAKGGMLAAPLGGALPQRTVLAVRRDSGRAYSAYDQFTLSVFCRQVEAVLENRQILSRLKTANLELTATQARLVESARLQTLGEVASSVAHDFNNVLGALLGRVQLLQHASSDAGVQSSLSKMERVIADGEGVVKKLQEAARGKRAEPRPTLDALVRDVFSTSEAVLRNQTQIHDRKIIWLTEFLPTAGIIEQATRMRSALRQLLTELSAESPVDSVVELHTSRVAGSDLLTITMASDPADPAGVFRWSSLPAYLPFALAVEQAQGMLSIQDREGESALEVRFSPRAPSSARHGGRELLRVLVVDDDQDVRDVLSEMLVTAGHDVKVAGDGAEALKQAADGTFDIVFTDLGMPGISGWQVVEQIKRDLPGLPVVMVTGWGHQLDPSQVERSGVDRVLTKPFQWVTVLDTIHQLVPQRVHPHAPEQAR